MNLRGTILVVIMAAAMVSACGESTESDSSLTPTVAATEQPAPTASPQAEAEPTATPIPASESASSSAVEAAADPTPVPPTQTQSIIFYDLTEIEKTCPGYQEFTGFRQTVSQVKITCTGPGVETVYFVDLDNLVVTGIRVPLLEPEMP